ncbi:MAG: hypothetical protein V3T23_07705, partial [Nitrososphaerales archaeon]
WIISGVTANDFTLDNSSGTGAYTTGGIAILTEFLVYRYAFDTRRWSPRKFNVANEFIRYFSRAKDGSLTIGYNSGILRYPLRVLPAGGTAGSVYEDQVTSVGNSVSRGFETLLKFNVGEIYSMRNQISLVDMLIDFFGQSANQGTDNFEIQLIANGETSAFDTKTQVFQDSSGDSFPVSRKIETRGPLRRLECQIQIPAADLIDGRRLDISKISFSHTLRRRVGVQ